MGKPRFKAIPTGAAKTRTTRARNQADKDQWYISRTALKIEMTVHQRVKLATKFLMNKVKANIAYPVVKDLETKRLVRSLPGEFPRAETTNLLQSVKMRAERRKGHSVGFVGAGSVDIHYAEKLELDMERPYLVRTLNEERHNIEKIIGGKTSN